MEYRKPRRPAQLDPEVLEYIEGEEDPQTSREAAHTSARAFVKSPTKAWSDPDPHTLVLLLQAIDQQGWELLAELWESSPSDTLPGALWRLMLIHLWVEKESENLFALIKNALPEKGLEAYVDPEGAASIDLPAWRQDLNKVFKAQFEGDFAQLLESTQALLRVLAFIQPRQENNRAWARARQLLADLGSGSELQPLRLADELFQAASLYRSGHLD